MTDIADAALLHGYFSDREIHTIAQDLRNGHITSVELIEHSLTHDRPAEPDSQRVHQC